MGSLMEVGMGDSLKVIYLNGLGYDSVKIENLICGNIQYEDEEK